MVARAAKQPLTLETITVDPPGAGEVRVKVIANALCHTDVYTCKKTNDSKFLNHVVMYVWYYRNNFDSAIVILS